MEKRIYLATKESTTVGVEFNVTENKALKISHKHLTKQTGFAGVRESALAVMVEQLRDMEFETATAPVQIFVVPSLHSMISNGTYKYWILTGKKSSGENVDEAELALWKEFHQIYVENSLYIIVKDIFGCRLDANSKFKPNKVQKQNDYYAVYCWDEIAKLVSDSPAVVDAF